MAIAINFSDFEEADLTGSLIRLQIKNNGAVSTAWGIVGAQRKEFLPVLILRNNAAPYVTNVSGHMGMLKSEFDKPIVVFGKNFAIEPYYDGHSEVGAREISISPGSYVLLEREKVIVADFPERNSRCSFNLETFAMRSAEFGGPVAAFSGWRIRMRSDVLGKEELIDLYTHRVN